MHARIASLHIYPLKSARGIELDESKLSAKGLPWDRHWMLIDGNSRFVSQRTAPRMALLSVSLFDDCLEVSFPDEESLSVPLKIPATSPEQATMHREGEPILVVSEGRTAAKWFSEILGGNLRLARIAPGFERSVPDLLGKDNCLVELADGYPYLVTSNASLDLFNNRLRELDEDAPKIEMQRFRPNIVLDIPKPWTEMAGGLTLENETGSIVFSLTKPCKRCGIPQVNPATGKRDSGASIHEVLTSLNSDHCQQASNFFGQNAVLERGSGEGIAVGQQLRIATKPQNLLPENRSPL